MKRSFVALAAAGALGLEVFAAAQAPPPLPNQRGQAAPPAAPQPRENLPSSPVVSPRATISAEAKGPGSMFPARLPDMDLLQWVDRGVEPPHAPRILIDRDVRNDGSLLRLDAHGNVEGGVPSPYLVVPVAQYSVPNSAAKPYPANLPPSADRGEQGVEALCRLTAYQNVFATGQLKALYSGAAGYRARVAREVDALTRAGWLLPMYGQVVLADAAKLNF